MTTMQARILFAHGAGQDSSSPFMQMLPTLLQPHGIEAVLFDFDYMIKARETGKRRPPERLPKLQAQFAARIEREQQALNAQGVNLPLFIGGKSMGGRVASTLVDEIEGVFGAICLGYPFHPPGKPEKLRTEHLRTLEKPILILQGTRDTFGKQQEVAEYELSNSINVHYIEDGDHSFTPRKASGLTWEQNMADAAQQIASFVQQLVN